MDGGSSVVTCWCKVYSKGCETAAEVDPCAAPRTFGFMS